MSNKDQVFSKEQVIAIIDEILQRPDQLIDAVENENTNWDAESLFDLAMTDIKLP